jgi:hypothetical protein
MPNLASSLSTAGAAQPHHTADGALRGPLFFNLGDDSAFRAVLDVGGWRAPLLGCQVLGMDEVWAAVLERYGWAAPAVCASLVRHRSPREVLAGLAS